MARDPLRSTLDNLSVDPDSAADRPYLEAALRRMGYSDAEIQERLGAAPPAPAAPAAPPTEYRLVKLVVPRSRKAVASSPFEDLNSNFEEVEDLAFEEMEPTPFEEVAREEEDLSFEEVVAASEASDEVQFPETASTPEQFEQLGAGEEPQREGLQWEEEQPAEAPAEMPAEEAPLDTIGAEADRAQRTRVRVRRVRAGSRQEAEEKIARGGGKVLKAIPVDIVERWGQPEAPAQPKKKGGR